MIRAGEGRRGTMRLSKSKSSLSSSALSGSAEEGPEAIEWELRPGGMLVQKREFVDPASSLGPLIKVKVSYGLLSHEISVPQQASFGDLKRLLVPETTLQPSEQRLLYRGKEKDDGEYLHVAGVKDKSKIILVEDPASREKKIQARKKEELIARACRAIATVRAEVDRLGEEIQNLQGTVSAGKKVPENDFEVLTEKLMMQLLKLDSIKLDSIDADGEAKKQRKAVVKRVQTYVEGLDVLKIRNAAPPPLPNGVVVTTRWETFDSGVGSLSAPPPTTNAQVDYLTSDWEQFE